MSNLSCGTAEGEILRSEKMLASPRKTCLGLIGRSPFPPLSLDTDCLLRSPSGDSPPPATIHDRQCEFDHSSVTLIGRGGPQTAEHNSRRVAGTLPLTAHCRRAHRIGFLEKGISRLWPCFPIKALTTFRTGCLLGKEDWHKALMLSRSFRLGIRQASWRLRQADRSTILAAIQGGCCGFGNRIPGTHSLTGQESRKRNQKRLSLSFRQSLGPVCDHVAHAPSQSGPP
jgi:hypothetical protein